MTEQTQSKTEKRTLTASEVQASFQALECVKHYVENARDTDLAIWTLKYIPFCPRRVKGALDLLEGVGRKRAFVLKTVEETPALRELGYTEKTIDDSYRSVVTKVHDALNNRIFRERLSARLTCNNFYSRGLAILLRDYYT